VGEALDQQAAGGQLLRQSCTSSHSRTSSGKRAQPARSTSSARTRSARCVVSGRRNPHVAGDLAAFFAARTISSMSFSRSTSRSSPAKRKVSPGEAAAKRSSTRPSERPLRKRTSSISAVDDDPGIQPVPRAMLGVGQPPGARPASRTIRWNRS
jgi:hypothetical protein